MNVCDSFLLLPESNSSPTQAAAWDKQAEYSGVPSTGCSVSMWAPYSSSSSRHSLWPDRKKEAQSERSELPLPLCGFFFHVGGWPFLAASWMGDASLKWVWTGAPCCRRSLTQAALPLLQELKRGVAPSADINAAYRGRERGNNFMAGQLLINFQGITPQAHHIRKNSNRHVTRCESCNRKLLDFTHVQLGNHFLIALQVLSTWSKCDCNVNKYLTGKNYQVNPF